MANRSRISAPKYITWVICLVLYLFAALTHFGILKLSGGAVYADWAWIIGFALLLVAVQVRDL